jgi:hypothetical protein
VSRSHAVVSADPVDAASAELERQGALDRLQAARLDLQALEVSLAATRAALASVRAEVERLERALRDDVVRWERFRVQEAQGQQAIANAQTGYQVAEGAVLAARAAFDLATRRTRFWRTCIALAAAALMGEGVLFLSDWRLLAAASLAVLLAALGAWLRAGRALNQARANLVARTNQWRSAGAALVRSWTELAALRIRHLVFSHVADWCRWLPDLARGHRGAVERFRSELDRLTNEAAARSAGWEPAPSPHVENVLPEGGLDGVLQVRAAQLATRVADFWRGDGHSFAERLREILTSRLTPEQLFEQMRTSLTTAFADLRSLSVEQFLKEHVPTPAERWTLVDRVHRAAAPFGKRVSRTGDLHAGEVTFAALAEEDARSSVREAILQLRHTATVFYRGTRPTEVMLSRVVVDLVPDQLAAAHESYRQLNELDDDVHRELYGNAGNEDSLPTLIRRNPARAIRTLSDRAEMEGPRARRRPSFHDTDAADVGEIVSC